MLIIHLHLFRVYQARPLCLHHELKVLFASSYGSRASNSNHRERHGIISRHANFYDRSLRLHVPASLINGANRQRITSYFNLIDPPFSVALFIAFRKKETGLALAISTHETDGHMILLPPAKGGGNNNSRISTTSSLILLVLTWLSSNPRAYLP